MGGQPELLRQSMPHHSANVKALHSASKQVVAPLPALELRQSPYETGRYGVIMTPYLCTFPARASEAARPNCIVAKSSGVCEDFDEIAKASCLITHVPPPDPQDRIQALEKGYCRTARSFPRSVAFARSRVGRMR
jgi:hypothetical protein